MGGLPKDIRNLHIGPKRKVERRAALKRLHNSFILHFLFCSCFSAFKARSPTRFPITLIGKGGQVNLFLFTIITVPWKEIDIMLKSKNDLLRFCFILAGILGPAFLAPAQAQELNDQCLIQDPSPKITSTKFLKHFRHSPEEIKKLMGVPDNVKISIECFPLPKFNFGVLVHNEHYSIYRSAALGGTGYSAVKAHLGKNKLPLPQSVIYMNKDGYDGSVNSKGMGLIRGLLSSTNVQNTDFAVAEDGRFSQEGINFYHPLAKEEGDANTYLGGHNPLEKEGTFHVREILGSAAEQFYRKKGVDFFSRILKGDREALYNNLDIILRKGGQRVLFHCKGGFHRTGMVALSIRHLQGGHWTKEFSPPLKMGVISNRILPKVVELRNLAEYEYYLHNQTQFRIENLEAIRALSQEARFLDLKEQYGNKLSQGSNCGS